MAASLRGSVLLRNANHNLYGIRVVATVASLPSSAASFPLAAVHRGLAPACFLLNRRVLGSLLAPEQRRPKKFVALAISHEDSVAFSLLVVSYFFMLTGSIPAIRFGIILGTAILALSVSSLRAWKNGKETPLLLVGQSAISAIIFFRQWLLCSQRGLFPNLLMLSISGAMLGFYVYRIAIHRYNKGDNLEQSSENYWP